MQKQPEKMTELLALLRKTKESEIDCDEFWEKGPSIAEGTATLNADVLASFLYHLEMCPGCLENFEILKSILKDSKE
ncbi:MAG: hypothetical protein K2X29_03270 [Candidatus Obscuribacterales bacterium]|nr:hypothetical protein [Candidatus Obscuribacterales bacterium]